MKKLAIISGFIASVFMLTKLFAIGGTYAPKGGTFPNGINLDGSSITNGEEITTNTLNVNSVYSTLLSVNSLILPGGDNVADIGTDTIGFSDIYLSDAGSLHFGNTISSLTGNGAGGVSVFGDLRMANLTPSRFLTLDADGDLSTFGTTTALATSLDSVTGSGALVLGTSPTLTTPTLGVATASELRVSDASGVKITGDGDGAITFLGMGNGADENLTLNLDDVANTVGITSTTGVINLVYDVGTGAGQVTLDGSFGGCLMMRDTDDAGWTECDFLNGVMTCSIDADGLCD